MSFITILCCQSFADNMALTKIDLSEQDRVGEYPGNFLNSSSRLGTVFPTQPQF
jgi:hypothetical protein